MNQSLDMLDHVENFNKIKNGMKGMIYGRRYNKN